MQIRAIYCVLLCLILCGCKDNSKQEAAEFFNRGVFHFKKNELDKAKTFFEEAIEKEDKFADAYLNLALVLEKQGNDEQALKMAKKASELDNKFYQAQFAYAKLLGKTDARKGLAEFQKLVEVYKDSSSYYNETGILYNVLGDYPSAKEAFGQSIKLAPANVDYRNNLAYSYYVENQLDSALSQLKKAEQINPKHAFTLHNQSSVYAKKNDTSTALSFARAATALEPDFRLFLLNEAFLAFEIGEWEEANKLQQRLKTTQEDPYWLRNEAISSYKRSNYQQAADLINRVIALDASTEYSYFYAGKIAQAQGNLTAAKSWFEKGKLAGDNRSILILKSL